MLIDEAINAANDDINKKKQKEEEDARGDGYGDVADSDGRNIQTGIDSSVNSSSSLTESASTPTRSRPPSTHPHLHLLPQLPTVLLDLIASYHSFDLPFMTAEAVNCLQRRDIDQAQQRSSS